VVDAGVKIPQRLRCWLETIHECAIEIVVEMMDKLEKEIPVFLCNMKRIFPLGFSIQCNMHLLIHLPYEAKVSGLILYRWMYHIKRSLRYLKPMVDNRTRV
jgi:hypothetical protein